MKVKCYSIRFDRARAERFIDALLTGKALPPPEGWSADAMLMLAGCCAAMMDVGLVAANQPALAGQHREHQEAQFAHITGGMDAIRLAHKALAAKLLTDACDALVPPGGSVRGCRLPGRPQVGVRSTHLPRRRGRRRAGA
jgi:hypothetical protein